MASNSLDAESSALGVRFPAVSKVVLGGVEELKD